MPDAETSERREILADPALSPIPHPAITNLDLNAMLHEASLRAAALLDQQDAPDARIELARMMACEGSRFDAQEVATRAGIHRAELSRIRRAYQLGGEIGVDVYLRTFDPGPDLRERLEQAPRARAAHRRHHGQLPDLGVDWSSDPARARRLLVPLHPHRRGLVPRGRHLPICGRRLQSCQAGKVTPHRPPALTPASRFSGEYLFESLTATGAHSTSAMPRRPRL
ncbi:hypothetical protein JOF29_007304 [Kribbella aluminosa]|uniref:Uncharacterized protein n=1 Tax=Kribbella aluminosa TaxID=416017 RepID=A0ABS4UX18_9ACTN|nr:hypothetical protein [Kribbella aluminosa]